MITIPLDKFLTSDCFDWKSAKDFVLSKGVIYCIKSNHEKMCYIGETIHFNGRMRTHLTGKSHCTYLNDDILKLGLEHFSVTMLETTHPTKNHLRERENYWQKYFRGQGYILYNEIGIIKRRVENQEKNRKEEEMKKRYSKSLKEVREIISEEDRETVLQLLEEHDKYKGLSLQGRFGLINSPSDIEEEELKVKIKHSEEKMAWCNQRVEQFFRKYGWNRRD